MTETTFDDMVKDCLERLKELAEVDRVETVIVTGLELRDQFYVTRPAVHVFRGSMKVAVHAPKYRI